MHCGEGGALLIRDRAWATRAEIVHEKGTDRSRFLRGEVDKYTWVDVGSSYPPSEVKRCVPLGPARGVGVRSRASGWRSGSATTRRLRRSRPAGSSGDRRARGPPARGPHLLRARGGCACPQRAAQGLEHRGVNAVFHYVPLHSSPTGLKYGRAHGDMRATQSASERLVRLPLWVGMTEAHVDLVVPRSGSTCGPESSAPEEARRTRAPHVCREPGGGPSRVISRTSLKVRFGRAQRSASGVRTTAPRSRPISQRAPRSAQSERPGRS